MSEAVRSLQRSQPVDDVVIRRNLPKQGFVLPSVDCRGIRERKEYGMSMRRLDMGLKVRSYKEEEDPT